MSSRFCKNRKYCRIYFSCFRHGLNHSSHSHFFIASKMKAFQNAKSVLIRLPNLQRFGKRRVDESATHLGGASHMRLII